MFADAKLKITASGRTFLPPDGFQKHKVGELPPETAAFILNDPQSHVFQYVFKAAPAPAVCGRKPERVASLRMRKDIRRVYVQN